MRAKTLATFPNDEDTPLLSGHRPKRATLPSGVIDRLTLGQRITTRREQFRLSQADLARKIQMSEAYINRLENGLVKSPKLYDLSSVAGALEISLDALVYPDHISNKQGGSDVLSRQPRLTSALMSLARGLQWAEPRDREFALSQLESLAKRFGPD